MLWERERCIRKDYRWEGGETEGRRWEIRLEVYEGNIDKEDIIIKRRRRSTETDGEIHQKKTSSNSPKQNYEAKEEKQNIKKKIF